MDTQKQFVERRRLAHAAGTQNMDKDPLVCDRRATWAQTAEVMARWHERRQTPTAAAPVVNRRIMTRRQAD